MRKKLIPRARKLSQRTGILCEEWVIFRTATYANLLHGLHFATDIGLDNWTWLVSARPVVLSGVLPLLVIYLSEVAGDDRNYTVKLAERETKRRARNVSLVQSALTPTLSNTALVDTELDSLALARSAKANADAQSKAAALDTILATLAAEPDTSIADLAQRVGKSRTTIYAYLDELEAAGRLRRDRHESPTPDKLSDILKEVQ